jgi:hypothetical protein
MDLYKKIIFIMIGFVICAACITDPVKNKQNNVEPTIDAPITIQGNSTDGSSSSDNPSAVHQGTGILIKEKPEFDITQINESAIPCLSYDLSGHSCDAMESLNREQILRIALKNPCIREIISDGGKVTGVGIVYVPSRGPATIDQQKTRGGYAPGIFLQYHNSRVSFGVDKENQVVISQVVEALSDSPVQDLKCNYTAIENTTGL